MRIKGWVILVALMLLGHVASASSGPWTGTYKDAASGDTITITQETTTHQRPTGDSYTSEKFTASLKVASTGKSYDLGVSSERDYRGKGVEDETKKFFAVSAPSLMKLHHSKGFFGALTKDGVEIYWESKDDPSGDKKILFKKK
jgi:hypothetical protein